MNDEEVYVSEQGEQIISRKKFYGLNRNFVIGSGELAESVNMSDRDFPALSTRAKRHRVMKAVSGADEEDVVDAVITGAEVMDGRIAILTANGTLYFREDAPITGLPAEQQLKKYNRRLYVFPAGISIECPPGEAATTSGAVYTHIYEIYGRTATADEDEARRNTDQERKTAWTDVHPVVSNAYMGADGVPVDSTQEDDPRTLIKIAIPAGPGSAIRTGDVIHACAVADSETLFDSDYRVEYTDNGGSAVYLGSGLGIASGTTLDTLTLERKMPVLDVCFEHAGRLWGARYGENADGEFVNEIYCTALNSFENWFRYGGTADDSWTCSVTREGSFTGGCALDGYPTFFKETGYFRIFGTGPDTYQMHTRDCEGIQKDSEGSAAVIGGSLYYKSPNGIMRLTDALPERISDDLGFDSYGDAVGGTDGIRYYVKMTDAGRSGDERIYVFNTSTGLWHTETMPFADGGHAPAFRKFIRTGSSVWSVSDRCVQSEEEIIAGNETLSALKAEVDALELRVAKGDANPLVKLLLLTKKIAFKGALAAEVMTATHYADIELLSATGPEDTLAAFPDKKATNAAREGEFPFEAVTAPVGYETPLHKYANKLYIRCAVYANARLDVDIRYDGEDEWRHVETLHGKGKVEFHNVCVRPVRCDHFRLRLSGVGEVKILETDIVYTAGSC